MKASVSALLAFAAAVLGKPVLLNSGYAIEEGVPFTFKWSGAEGPVTLTLMTGDPSNLKPVYTIVSGVTDSQFTWTPSDIPSGTYAVRISDESGEPNYSTQFSYLGTATAFPSQTVSETSAVTTATSASLTTLSTITTTSEATATTEESSTTTEETTTTETRHSTTTTGSATTTRVDPTVTPDNTNAGQRFASPLALVLVTVAALVFFN